MREDLMTTNSAKYPLAMVDKLIDIFNIPMLIGYDIGCGFTSTCLASEKVSGKFQKSGMRFSVGSFHGHAHARKCQLDWHPLYIEGTGLEDLETCERLFSGSNMLARCTRQASVYNRKELIGRFMKVWNSDKYLELSSSFKYNHVHTVLT